MTIRFQAVQRLASPRPRLAEIIFWLLPAALAETASVAARRRRREERLGGHRRTIPSRALPSPHAQRCSMQCSPPRMLSRCCWTSCSLAASWPASMLQIVAPSSSLLPVDELYAPAEGQVSGPGDLLRAFDNGPGSVAEKLVDLVQSEVVSHSSAVKGGVELN